MADASSGGTWRGWSNSPAYITALDRIQREDAIGQLRRREGAMAHLGSDQDALMLDWVEMLPWLLERPSSLTQVEMEAAALRARGTRHIIWAGMGGSVLTIHVLRALGFCDAPVAIHPLDSTDPAALNAIIHAIASAKGFTLPEGGPIARREILRPLLEDVVMIGVAMGMTSEEPITHLEWFSHALDAASLPRAERMLSIALPGSYLDQYAERSGVTRLALQLDGGAGIGGRMSAPGTRVFLLPAALSLVGHAPNAGKLAALLERAWQKYDLEGAQANPAQSQFARLAAALSAASYDGVAKLFLSVPHGWEMLIDWVEQLMEESLGKSGKGVIVFAGEPPHTNMPGALHVRLTGTPQPEDTVAFTLHEPLIASGDPRERLAGLAALFLGFQLVMALYGYLHGITFAGQPAVENYKARARRLREEATHLAHQVFAQTATRDGALALLAPHAHTSNMEPARVIAAALTASRRAEGLAYLDLTINGEAPAGALARLESSLRRLATEHLGVPYKLRRAPAAYHSTEQSEMDGPAPIVSIRALALRHESILIGEYSPAFLEAQALATWQAMDEQKRVCFLALYDGDTLALLDALRALLDAVAQYL